MYAVKVVATATEKNKNFAGEVSVYWYGKEQTLLGFKDRYLGGNHEPYPLMIREYGYRRESDARRSWMYKNSENTEFWEYEVSIVEL